MKKYIKSCLFGAIFGLANCAEYPKNITAVYIPSIVYSGASCYEIMNERRKLVQYVNSLTRKQQRTANWDTAFVTTSLFITWPAIAGLPFTEDQSAQLAVARGHYDALVKASNQYDCYTPEHSMVEHSDKSWKRYRSGFPPI